MFCSVIAGEGEGREVMVLFTEIALLFKLIDGGEKTKQNKKKLLLE